MRPFGWKDELLVKIANVFLRGTSKEYKNTLANLIIYGMHYVDSNKK